MDLYKKWYCISCNHHSVADICHLFNLLFVVTYCYFMQMEQLPISMRFLNELSTSEASDLMAHILSKDDYDSVINRKNLDDEITPEELQSFTSITAEDGM